MFFPETGGSRLQCIDHLNPAAMPKAGSAENTSLCKDLIRAEWDRSAVMVSSATTSDCSGEQTKEQETDHCKSPYLSGGLPSLSKSSAAGTVVTRRSLEGSVGINCRVSCGGGRPLMGAKLRCDPKICRSSLPGSPVSSIAAAAHDWTAAVPPAAASYERHQARKELLRGVYLAGIRIQCDSHGPHILLAAKAVSRSPRMSE